MLSGVGANMLGIKQHVRISICCEHTGCCSFLNCATSKAGRPRGSKLLGKRGADQSTLNTLIGLNQAYCGSHCSLVGLDFTGDAWRCVEMRGDALRCVMSGPLHLLYTLLGKESGEGRIDKCNSLL